jgi:hypothetical protein
MDWYIALDMAFAFVVVGIAACLRPHDCQESSTEMSALRKAYAARRCDSRKGAGTIETQSGRIVSGQAASGATQLRLRAVPGSLTEKHQIGRLKA